MNQEGLKTLKLGELNSLLGSIEDFYNRLSVRGIYLPNRDKRCISTDYMLGVLKGEYFSLKRSDVKFCFPLKKASKLDLCQYLTEAIHPNRLGFKLTHLPNRQWLENCLFTIKPDHPLFKKPEMPIKEREFEIPEW